MRYEMTDVVLVHRTCIAGPAT